MLIPEMMLVIWGGGCEGMDVDNSLLLWVLGGMDECLVGERKDAMKEGARWRDDARLGGRRCAVLDLARRSKAMRHHAKGTGNGIC
jgi:hypothetical protein